MPYRDNSTAVQALFQQLLQSGDDKVKYNTMTLLLRKNKDVPDSLLAWFAAKEEYRYDLYTDLNDIDKLNLFPEKYNNHLDLAKSKILGFKSYDRPDSIVYLDRLPATQKSNKGFVYFFKYKQKKDDDIWKIATVGLVPEDPRKFEFEENDDSRQNPRFYNYDDGTDSDFTALTDAKLKDDEPMADQLNTVLKRLLYSSHRSAKEFYDKEDSRYTMDITRKY